MNGYREVVLTRAEWNLGYRCSHFFMVNDVIHYARLRHLNEFGHEIKEVIFFRRMELRDCLNRVDNTIDLTGQNF